MKRLIILFAVLSLSYSLAFAESGQTKEAWESLGSWLWKAAEETANWTSETLTEASRWAEGTWREASKWMDDNWGEASKWIEQAWNESSQWASDIWGDFSSWAKEAYESASGSIGLWWVETFKIVTESTKNPWNWLVQESAALTPELRETLMLVKSAVLSNGADAEAKVKEVFDLFMEKLKIGREDAQKVWASIQAYAEEKGISLLTAEKLSLPYLFQLTIENVAPVNSIPAVAIAQYLTGIAEKLDIHTEEHASGMMNQLNEILSTLNP